jgi:hypothetical protein
MQFRVSAIQDEGVPVSMNDARCWLEDWINKALRDFDFGCTEANIMIVVFCTSSLPKAPPISRLTGDGSGKTILALHVSIDPQQVKQTEPENQLSLLCSHIVLGLPVRPLRKPKGLDYERMRKALVATIQPLAQSAA